MSRLIQVLSFTNISRIAIKTARVVMLRNPEGHFDVLCAFAGTYAWVPICRTPGYAVSTIQRCSTDLRVYRFRRQVVRAIRGSGCLEHCV
jgi:hypothetical protein